MCGEIEALRAVLAAGASVAKPDVNGGTPLHYAAQMCGASYSDSDSKLQQSNSSKLALEILGILLSHPQTSVDVQDKDGRQPLLWAASAGSAKAVLALVKAGARVESADKWVTSVRTFTMNALTNPLPPSPLQRWPHCAALRRLAWPHRVH